MTPVRRLRNLRVEPGRCGKIFWHSYFWNDRLLCVPEARLYSSPGREAGVGMGASLFQAPEGRLNRFNRFAGAQKKKGKKKGGAFSFHGFAPVAREQSAPSGASKTPGRKILSHPERDL